MALQDYTNQPPPAYIPPAPPQPAPQPLSYTAGTGQGHWGYTGTEGGVGTPTGGSWSTGGGYGTPGFGMQPGSPGFNATAGAYEQSQQAAQDALNRLAPGQFLGGGYGGVLGNAAMGRYTNAEGFDPAALQQQRQMLTSGFAGARENNLRTIDERARASGFGDSMGVVDAQSRARAQSAQDLNNALNQLMFQNEQAKLQQQGTAAGLLGNLAGAESNYGTAYALAQMNRQYPVIPGVTPGPSGSYGGYGQPSQSGGYWNQSGRYMPGEMPYDPFVPPGTGNNYGTQGGWSPQQPRPMW